MTIRKNIVFIKNKLITIDTILPILIELKHKYNMESEIIVFDQLAHDGINENIVIKEAINYVGKEIFLTKGKGKFIRKVHILVGLVPIIIKSIRGANIFHFGALNQYPLKILGLMFKKNVYMFQGNAYDFQYSKYEHLYGSNANFFKNIGDNLVVFSSEKKYHKNGAKRIFDFGETRTRKVWTDYVGNRLDQYLYRFHRDVKLSNGAFVVIMSSLDGLSPKLEDPMHDQLWLFNDTIDALLPYSDDIPIFIKPHVYTNIELLKKIVNDKKNVFITYLHPTLLAMKARLFICNQFSNVMADGHSLGVTTIEYTNYNKELLNATSGESVDKQFVSYFINNNYAELKNIISNIAESSHKSFYYRGISDDKSGLLESIVSKR